MRYYVYSIEYGYPPMAPYHETNDFDEAKSLALGIMQRADCTAYVVDREPITMYEEVFMAMSSSFKRVYSMRYEAING